MSATRLVADGPGWFNAGLVHRVRLPAGDGPYPTVVMLHGRAGDENVMWVFAPALPPDWLVVAPRAPTPDAEGGFAWHPRRPDEWPTLHMFGDAVDVILRFVHALPDLYQADPRRVYLMGFSQGAAAAYATALRHPDQVRGIAGLVGFMPAEHAGALHGTPLRGKPVFAAVGRQDPAIPLALAQASAAALRAAGADLDYHEYEAGHRLNPEGMRGLTAWWQARAAQG